MPNYKVLSPLKHNKKRYPPGAIAELPKELGDSLAADGVVEPTSASPEKPSLTHSEGDSQPSESPSLLNINTATAEQIADQINGIGLTTAKAIAKQRDSLPDKKFTSLEELRTIPRVDWDAVFPLITLE